MKYILVCVVLAMTAMAWDWATLTIDAASQRATLHINLDIVPYHGWYDKPDSIYVVHSWTDDSSPLGDIWVVCGLEGESGEYHYNDYLDRHNENGVWASDWPTTFPQTWSTINSSETHPDDDPLTDHEFIPTGGYQDHYMDIVVEWKADTDHEDVGCTVASGYGYWGVILYYHEWPNTPLFQVLDTELALTPSTWGDIKTQF